MWRPWHRDFDESLKLLSDSRDRCARVAETNARVEEDLNEGLTGDGLSNPGLDLRKK